MVVKCLCEWNCMTLHSFFPHPSLCLMTKTNLLKMPLSSFNPRKQLFLCLQPWFGETTPPERNPRFRIFSSTINWRKIILQKKNKISIISILSIGKRAEVSGTWKFHVKDSKSCIVNFCYCSFTGVFKGLWANFLTSSYFPMNHLVRASKILFKRRVELS